MTNDTQAAIDEIVYKLKYLCDCVIPHCGDTSERKDAQLKIDEIIKEVGTLQSKPVDVGTLLDMVERAEEDMVIGAERHQSGTIDGNRELARSGIRYMEKAKPYIDLLETLADIEHERWSGWMRYFYDNNTPENNERWQKQMVTPYKDLPEHSKESDRREVRKTLAAINIPPQSPVTKKEEQKALNALKEIEDRYIELYSFHFSDYEESIGKENIDTICGTLEKLNE